MPNGTSRLPALPIQDIQSNDDNSLKIIEAWTRDTVAPYITYTPVITGTSGAFVYGTGAYRLGRWKRAGPRVQVEILIFFGNPGFNSGGNTTWSISLPILPILETLPIEWSTKLLGSCFLNSGLGQNMHGCLAHRVAPGGAVLRDFIIGISGGGAGQTLTGTVPAWAQGAVMQINLSYECAS